MSQTIGKRFRGKLGDSTAHCSYCGVRWLRSELVRDASGRFACPDDVKGRDEVTLDQANAAAAKEFASRFGKKPVNDAPYFKTDPNETPVYYRNRNDLDI